MGTADTGGSTRPDLLHALSYLEPHNREALDALVPMVYRELRTIAHRHLRANGNADSLNSTALVHEAYLKLGKDALARGVTME